MDESLIPKQVVSSSQPPVHGQVGAFFRLAFFFFIGAAFLVGVLFLYRNFSSNSLADRKTTLTTLEAEFEPAFLTEVNRFANAIFASKEVLAGRLSQSRLFTLLEENTISSVAYSTFSFDESDHVLVLLGEALSFGDVSLQATIFEELPEIKKAQFSNLTLRENGRVSFTLTLNF